MPCVYCPSNPKDEIRCEDCGGCIYCCNCLPQLSVADVKEALEKAAPGADQLHRDLEQVFTLSPDSANLRLR